MNFEHFTPTRIVFGRGRLNELGTIAASLGRNALLITGRGAMSRLGHLGRAIDLLKKSGVAATAFQGISPNPRSDEVDAAVQMARSLDIDLIVALGGGSALDAAKAVAVGMMHPRIGPLIGRTLEPHPGSLPMVAVPTTAGTGSEVTKGAIILDVERQFKSGIRGDDLFPKVALVDPALTDSLPAEVAIETGFDALTHALESFLARKANPINRALSRAAIERLRSALPRLADGGADAATRDDLALAALIGGLNVATASSCLPHRLQQAMGSLLRIQVSHARGLALVYPAWLKRASAAAPAAFAEVGAMFDAPDGEGAAAVTDLLGRIGMSARLRDFGYRPDDIDHFVANVSGNIENDPIPDIAPATVRAIYEEVF